MRTIVREACNAYKMQIRLAAASHSKQGPGVEPEMPEAFVGLASRITEFLSARF